MAPTDDAFFREAKSQIRALNDGLLALEGDGDASVGVAELFRVAHSLKGSCHTRGLDDAGDLAHALEDALDAIRAGEVAPTPALVDEALATVDLLEAAVRAAAVGGDVEGDVEATQDSLRTTLEEERAAMSTGPNGTPDGPAAGGADDEWDPADDDLSEDVVAALKETTEFDDLDALVEEMDDPEGDEELDGWGMLDDGTPDSAPSSGEPDGRQTPGGSSGSETPDEPSAFFEETKSRVGDDADIDALQADIDAVEFGEFDDDDNYTIEELVELDPDEAPGDAAGGPADAGPDEASPADANGSSDAEGSVSAGPAEPVSDETTDSTATDAPESSGVEPDDAGERADDAHQFVFGADHGTEAAADESGTADESETTDGPEAGTEPETTEEPETSETPELAGDSGSAATDEPGESAEPSEVTESDAGSASESIPDPDSASEPVPDADSVPDLDSMPDVAPGPDADSVPETDLDVDLSGEFDADLGDGSAGGLDDGASAETDMEVSVDEEVAEFESRFGDLLGDGPGGDDESEKGAVFRSAVATIEESRLDADQFPTGDRTDRPGDSDEFDRLQAMTVDVDTADRLLDVAEELSLTHLRLDEAIGPETDEAIREEVSNLLRVVTEYRRTVMDVRLTPLETAVDTIPRTVRDVARSQDKEVDLAVNDADVDLDRSIVDRLRDPLAHLARNAVDHGIEPPEEREAAGKPREGTVEITAERVGDEVVIELSDDGRGIDPATVRERAVENGVVTETEAERLDDEETYDLVFEPGFTTTEEVTDVSGRGVGMDVVNRTVADLNGSVTVDSDPGRGTTVRLRVPVSIALTEVLFVEAADQTFGVPMTAVEQITAAPSVEEVDGRDAVRRSNLDLVGGLPEGVAADDAYPLVELRSALGLSEPDAAEAGPANPQVVWIRDEAGRLAVRVDRVVASQEVVVRPYGDLLRDVPGVSGATTLGDGEAVNVLDVATL